MYLSLSLSLSLYIYIYIYIYIQIDTHRYLETNSKQYIKYYVPLPNNKTAS